MENQTKLQLLTSADIANYVVCPESWRLKFIGKGVRQQSDRSAISKQLRKEWVEKQDLYSKLRSYSKIAYVLLFLLAAIVFLLETKRSFFAPLDSKPAVTRSPDTTTTTPTSPPKEIPSEISFLLLILGLIIFMWDLFDRRSKNIRKDSGLVEEAETVSLKGSSFLPSKNYYSEKLGLSSKPDAVVREGDFTIPVDIHPLTKKIRDRHVAVLLLHLKLIEESEGRASPYGVLLIGNNQRRVMIKYSVEKQRWLESILDEMRSIIEGVPAVPSPSFFKCKQCDVHSICNYSAYKGNP